MADRNSTAERRERKPKGARGEAWGILNPYGDLWSFHVFDTPEQARQHVADFWRGVTAPRDLNAFKPVRVRVHVTVLANQEQLA